MSLLQIIVLLLFIVRTTKMVLYHVYLWQLKEYRLDRMLSFLKTNNGLSLLFNPLSITKWILTLIIVYVAVSGKDKDLTYLTVGLFAVIFEGIWILEGLKATLMLLKKSWKIPKLTRRVLIVLILIITFIVSLFILKIFNSGDIFSFYWLLFLSFILDRLLFIVISLAVATTEIPKSILVWKLHHEAREKVKSIKILKVIGITGSVGKTSTKDFAASILSHRFKVVKTPNSNNVDIAIARTIIDQIRPEDEIFIAEMGAYKKGEIKSICDMVHPAIGVVTNIGTQHMELFGSQKNIIEAKYELIDALPPNGVAILNADNPYCVKMAEKARAKGLKTILFGTDKNADIIARDSKMSKKGIEFTLTLRNERKKISTRLLGTQNIPNLLAAISIATSLGMKPDDIALGVTNLTSPSQTMQYAGKINNTTLIDDTFNASVESLDAALDYMTLYTGEKILILTPLIELGDNAKSIHEDIATKCAKMCDKVFLTNQNYYKNIISGASRVPNGEKKIDFISAKNSIDHIKNVTTKDSIALFEGKESARILHTLI